MIAAAASKLGSSLAQRLLLRSLPALAFWTVGAAAWLDHRGFEDGWESATDWIDGRSATVSGVLLLAVALAVSSSAAAVRLLTIPTLRIAEGYWPRWCAKPANALRRRHSRKASAMEQRFASLARRVDDGKADPADRDALLRIDARLRDLPSTDALMPTAVGNALRSGERWPWEKWGLDIVKCWPQLWLVMPDDRRKALDAARAALDATAGALTWTILAIVWVVLAWWAALLSVAGATLAYLLLLREARRYARLVEATADIHYTALVEAIGWSATQDAGEPRAHGVALTEFVWRGTPRGGKAR